jgi:hypothetical protein
MPDLTQLDNLLKTWRNYAASLSPTDERTRLSGFRSGVSVCADQLEETIARMRADAENDDA